MRIGARTAPASGRPVHTAPRPAGRSPPCAERAPSCAERAPSPPTSHHSAISVSWAPQQPALTSASMAAGLSTRRWTACTGGQVGGVCGRGVSPRPFRRRDRGWCLGEGRCPVLVVRGGAADSMRRRPDRRMLGPRQTCCDSGSGTTRAWIHWAGKGASACTGPTGGTPAATRSALPVRRPHARAAPVWRATTEIRPAP